MARPLETLRAFAPLSGTPELLGAEIVPLEEVGVALEVWLAVGAAVLVEMETLRNCQHHVYHLFEENTYTLGPAVSVCAGAARVAVMTAYEVT